RRLGQPVLAFLATGAAGELETAGGRPQCLSWIPLFLGRDLRRLAAPGRAPILAPLYSTDSDMSERRPGLLRRLFIGSWRVLDFSRRFILTVLFLVAVVLLLAAMLRPDLTVGDRTVLVVAPVGAVVEQYSSSASDRAIAKLTGS